MNTLKRYLAGQFELGRGSASNSKSMEGMRGFAVALVFLVHYCTLGMPYVVHTALMPAVAATHLIGNFGVNLFFVLSGYLIDARRSRERVHTSTSCCDAYAVSTRLFSACS